MEKLKKMAIYPFESADIALVRFMDNIQSTYVIGNVCSTKGSGYIGKDVGFVENRNSIGHMICEMTEEIIQCNDTLLILEHAKTLMYDKVIALMQEALNKQKEVICLMNLLQDDKNELINLAKKESGIFLNELVKKDATCLEKEMNCFKAMQKPKIPVVFFSSLLDKGDTEEVIIGLSEALRRREYKTACFVRREIYNLLNMHSYNFLFDTNNITQTIEMINHFIHAIELSEKPDILLVEIPGTIIRHNEIIHGDFGIGAYVFSQIIQADISICSSYYLSVPELFKVLNDVFYEKFEFGVDIVHYTNKILDMSSTSYERGAQLLKVGNSSMEKITEIFPNDNGICYCNLLNEESCNKVALHITEKLLQ